MGTITTWEMFGGFARPAWAGPVSISDNNPNTGADFTGINARNVMGIIVPVTTAGRPSAPVPLSGAATGMAMGTDKGHLMALDIGGPDISHNIVPQASLWQQSGGWRAIETNAQALAMAWMGIDRVYDPSDYIPPPELGAFFRVAPYSEIDAVTGQPLQYTGTVTKVRLWPGSEGVYDVHPDEETHMFLISPQGVWWQRGQKSW